MDTKENLIDNQQIELKDNSSVSLEDGRRNQVQGAILSKTERLVSAIHLVTSLMDNEDSLRWQLRTVSVDSLKDFYSIGHWQINDDKKFVSEKIFNNIAHIISLLDVGLSGGLISSMNHKILKDEYLKLRGTLERIEITSGADSFTLPQNFFGESLSSLGKLSSNALSLVPQNIAPINEHANIKDIESLSFTKFDSTEKKVVVEKKVKKDVKFGHAAKRTLRGADKLSRQDMIIEIFRGGGVYTIKDIIAKMSVAAKDIDCSEKTIQRDLIFLVSNKTLNKQGERRWSRYSLSATSQPSAINSR